MRIGLLTQYYKPEMGAPQNRLYEMVKGLHELGNELCVVTAMPNYPTGRIFDGYRNKITHTETLDGIEVKRYWLHASNTRKIIPRIWNMVSFSLMSLLSFKYLRSKKLDYLIIESPPLTLGLTGILMSKICHCKLISNISDLWPLSAKELGAISEGITYSFLEKVEAKIYYSSHIVLGQSQEICDYIRQHGAKNVYLFRNGVDTSRFNQIKIEKGSKPVKLVYAGLLGYAQGIADICKSINFTEIGAEFHIYGEGGEKSIITKYIEEHPNCGIIYHGVVSRQELPLRLQESDLTLIPLVKNIFGAVPSKIYESMAAGLPIMFMGEGEGAQIIRENHIGLVAHSLDYSQLKSNIEYIVSHPDEMTIMSGNCRVCAQTKYNRPKQISALNDYLSVMLSAK